MNEPNAANDSEKRFPEILALVSSFALNEAEYALGAVVGQLMKLGVLMERDMTAIEAILEIARRKVTN